MLAVLADPTPTTCAQLEEWGVTDLFCAPWMNDAHALTPPGPSLEAMVDALADFAERYVR